MSVPGRGRVPASPSHRPCAARCGDRKGAGLPSIGSKELLERSALERGVSRGKAPRVRRSAFPFARGCVKRPCARLAQAGSRIERTNSKARVRRPGRVPVTASPAVAIAMGRRGVSESSRVGAKLPRRAIGAGGASDSPSKADRIEAPDPVTLSLAPRIVSFTGGFAHRASSSCHRLRRASVEDHGEPRASGSAGRACGSFRLQMSTSGAWRRARVRDERTKAAGLAPSLRSRERRSVGSRIRAAKPERPVAGSRSRSLAKAGVRANTRRWKAPWVVRSRLS